jgi:hypothetical protein
MQLSYATAIQQQHNSNATATQQQHNSNATAIQQQYCKKGENVHEVSHQG